MLFDLAEHKLSEKYKLMAQTIIPRPIAWVVTENEGNINIAPFSYFMGLSSEPATVLLSVGHKKDGTPKDTLFNIRKNNVCTICMVDEHHLEKMHFSSQSLDRDISEAEQFDIETQVVFEGYPPMITGVSSAYFCHLNQEIDLGGGATIPLILNVKQMFIDDKYITNKDNLTIKINPIARMGKSYALLGKEIIPPVMPKNS